MGPESICVRQMRLSIEQPQIVTTTPLVARSRTICLLLICSSLVGCSAYPLGFARKSRQECFSPIYGVDDHQFHGHRKTCWRHWDDPAWQAIPCPNYLHQQSVTAEIPIPPFTSIQSAHQPAPTIPDAENLRTSPSSADPLMLPPVPPPDAPELGDVP